MSLIYQSPIALNNDNIINIVQCAIVKGKNRGAVYNPIDKIFEVQDKIILKIDSNRYQLEEYHYHIPSEHKVNGKIYPAEIHYVFIKLGSDQEHLPHGHKCTNICGRHNITPTIKKQVDSPPNAPGLNENILVIGRVIQESCHDKPKKLTKVQVSVPKTFYQYDGSLTTGTFAPVRWIVGKKSISANIAKIIPIAKTARPLQNLDNRIILFVHNKC